MDGLQSKSWKNTGGLKNSNNALSPSNSDGEPANTISGPQHKLNAAVVDTPVSFLL